MNVKHQVELDEDVTLPEVFEEVNCILEKHNITRQRSQVRQLLGHFGTHTKTTGIICINIVDIRNI